MNAGADPRGLQASERILVLVKGRREARLTLDLLARDGLAGYACESMAALCAAIDEGAGAVLLAEELLNATSVQELRGTLARQPPWSDLPIVVFSAPPGARRTLADSPALLGNVTFLDRPVRVRSMLASLHAAIGSRHRQYDARRAIESRDAFLAMLGHELRNPLAAISLAANIIERKTPAGEHHRERAILVRQTAHLARLVDDLLEVARFTHGKISVSLQKLDLVDVVRAAFDAVQGRASEHGLDYDLAVSAGPLWVDADRQRLEQAFLNLLTNAIKYTPRGGSVRVVVRQDGDSAVVEVTDSGIGLAEGMRGRVFDPFAQVDTSLDRAEGGLGLGLAIVRAVVALHGGSVEALSEGLSRGSCFVVRLPRLPTGTVVASPPPQEESRVQARLRVLLVEDNDDIRELFTEIVRGHEVTCAGEGPMGLDKILTWGPDIAFVDIGLPGLDGFEIARRARASGFTGRLVALTGYGQTADRRRALEAGFDDHLIKPVLGADIERALHQAEV